MRKKFERVQGFLKENKKEIFQLSLMAAVVFVPMMFDHGVCEAAKMGKEGMPWKKGTEAMMDELNGPLPKIAGICAVAGTGIMMAFGEMQGLAKKGCQTVFGLGIAISAPALIGALTDGDSAAVVAGCLF